MVIGHDEHQKVNVILNYLNTYKTNTLVLDLETGKSIAKLGSFWSVADATSANISKEQNLSFDDDAILKNWNVIYNHISSYTYSPANKSEK